MKKLVTNSQTTALLELKSQIASHPLLKNINYSDHDVVLLHRYLFEIDNCQKCQGLDTCSNSSKGYQPMLITDPYLDVLYKGCKYYQTILTQELQNQHISALYLPKKILEASFDEFYLSTEERKKAFNYAVEFASTYTNDHYLDGMYIYGTFNTGKTYLLSCIAKKLAQRNIKSLLIYFPDLARSIKQAINDRNLEMQINQLKTVDVLMLDDFGAEMMTMWLRDEIISPIIQYRLLEKKPVFITSNLNLEELVKHISNTKDGSGDQLKSSRLIERFKEMMVLIKLTVHKNKLGE